MTDVGVATELGQIEIARGEQRVGVVALGGGLRSYEAGGRELLDGFRPGERPASGRGQVLVPWPNRIEDGSYEFEGKRLQLPLSEPENGNAIHGLVRGAAWNLVDHEPDRVVLDYTLEPQPGYPFALGLSIEYALSAAGLTVTTTARNLSSGSCPYGAGQHPYLTLGTPTIDTLRLQAPGRVVAFSDERGLPVRSAPVDGTEYDFRAGREIGGTVLDNAFTELERDGDSKARVLLDDAAGGAGLTLWVDESYRYLMLYTGDSRPDVARRGLAVEPMTCPPNAFRTGESVIRLEPGESIASSWGIEPRLASEGGPDDR
ncbi:MAG TPA: aldose 1-epimerase family protein [Acidimicrobiia bacterium]|nr:aldose 1-epimerase family protein [Acidimicrobiia bacterium]